MSLSVSFTTSQTLGNPAGINLVDGTTGSDPTAATRLITLQTATGQYLTANGLSDTDTPTNWPIADGSTITLDYLTEDMALNITLSYVNSGGTSVGSDTILCGFTLFDESFYYELTQNQALQNQPPPMIIQDSNYYMNKMIFRVEIDSGNQAIAYGNDIVSAQNCYSRATYMRLQQNDFF